MSTEQEIAQAPVEFDPFSEEFFTGAYATFRRLRDEKPVYYLSLIHI